MADSDKTQKQERRTMSSALDTIRRVGVETVAAGVESLPDDGPGIKASGAIDYLKGKGYVFARLGASKRGRR